MPAAHAHAAGLRLPNRRYEVLILLHALLRELDNFELFRSDLDRAVPRSDRAKGGRPPSDHVLMFKRSVLQTFSVWGWPTRCGRQYDLDLPRRADASPDRGETGDRGPV
jgi:hypothetical protein